jgi:Ran GTPase-activating protein (RanGAP) involved in mRNA processing and transport
VATTRALRGPRCALCLLLLANVLCYLCRRSLKNLDLGGNDAGPESATALAEALVSHPSLTLLELGYNPLGPAGAATITGAQANAS